MLCLQKHYILQAIFTTGEVSVNQYLSLPSGQSVPIESATLADGKPRRLGILHFLHRNPGRVRYPLFLLANLKCADLFRALGLPLSSAPRTVQFSNSISDLNHIFM